MDHGFKYLELLVEKAAKLTATPQSFLASDDKGGVEKAEALRTRFMLFLKRIEGYRESYEAVQDILKMALDIEKVAYPEDIEFKLTFDFGLPKDPQVQGLVWGQALLDGIASVETAVRNFQDLDDDLLDEELKRIKDDQAISQAMGMAPPNANAPDVKPVAELNLA